MSPDDADPHEDATGPSTPETGPVDPRIEALTNDALETFRASLSHLIDRRIEGIHYAETRRGQLVVAGAAIAAAGLAALSVSAQGSGGLHGAALGASIAAVALGALSWFLYFLQTNPKYQFVAPSETRKWFYHHALPDKDRLAPPKLTTLFSKTKRATLSNHYPNEYRHQFELFKDAQVPILSNPKADASEDLKQLFLLHVNELTKNRQLTQLRTLLTRGIVAIAIAAAVGGLLGAAIDSGSGNRHHSEPHCRMRESFRPFRRCESRWS